MTFIIVFMMLNSCSTTSTVITGTWNNDTINQRYDHILVAALSENVAIKSTLEEDLAAKLEEEGIKVTKSIDVMPPKLIEDDNQKKKILENIQQEGVNGILTISLLDQQTETRYIPGGYDYAPGSRFGYYSNFWSYYDYWYPRFQADGYYATNRTYFIETNLYDAGTENLVWSTQSETYSPDRLQMLSDDYSNRIIARMAADDLINAMNESN
jgi:hypothetical protein